MAVPAEKTNDAYYAIDRGTAGYEDACAFTRSVFEQKLECQLDAFYPQLNVFEDTDGIQAVCGIRSAAAEPLFLEQYLDSPIERYLGDIPRGGIVEIGGFAANSRIAALHLMGWSALMLHDAGFSHVVCTANRAIRGCLRKLGIEFQEISTVDQAKLGSANAEWGRYYDTAPLMLAGSIASGVKSVERFA